MKHIFIIMGICIGCHAAGQNLIGNPGFEAYVPDRIKMHKIFTLLKDTSSWRGHQTPDYFNPLINEADGWKAGTVPVNKFGCAYPHTGNAYAGISSDKRSWRSKPDYDGREFIIARLLQPMEQGSTYRITLYSKPGKCSPSVTCISVFFSDSMPVFQNSKSFYRDFSARSKRNITRLNNRTNVRDNWNLHEGTYVAGGMEKFIAIGKFEECGGDSVFYYYLDDIYLEQVTDALETVKEEITADYKGLSRLALADKRECQCKRAQPKLPEVILGETDLEKLVTGKPYIIRNIYFGFNSAELHGPSEKNLESLAGYLKAHPACRIKIVGHTDDIGTKSYNHQLSLNRAKAVSSFLLAQGINAASVQYEGKGSTEPVGDNSTPSGRKENRRVELIIVSK